MLYKTFTFTGTLHLLATPYHIHEFIICFHPLPSAIFNNNCSFLWASWWRYVLSTLFFVFANSHLAGCDCWQEVSAFWVFTCAGDHLQRERAAADSFSLSHVCTHTHDCDVTSTLPCQEKVFFSFNIHGGQRGLHPPTVFTSLWEENTKNIYPAHLVNQAASDVYFRPSLFSPGYWVDFHDGFWSNAF